MTSANGEIAIFVFLEFHPYINNFDLALTILGLENRVEKLSNASSLWTPSRRGYTSAERNVVPSPDFGQGMRIFRALDRGKSAQKSSSVP